MESLKTHIKAFRQDFSSALASARDQESLEQVRIQFLGRKGRLADLMTHLKELPLTAKQELGPLINELKQESEKFYESKKQELSQQALQLQLAKQQSFDVTAYLPGQAQPSLHPLTHILWQVEDIFISMGYEIVDGPEVETEFYNFEALNIPADHPAREMWDTFWLDIPGLLLRTHTSSVEIHAMKQQKPPLAIASPGRCYRHEATDASHDYLFAQTEGLIVDKHISMGQGLAIAKTFLQTLFDKKDLEIRVRPSYFPFVEPGVEIDISCPFCTGGCSVCKRSGWIEICGAGLTSPNVLKYVDIDPSKYSGFAFGFGLTRLAMLKYGINDIRLLHQPTVAFLNQF